MVLPGLYLGGARAVAPPGVHVFRAIFNVTAEVAFPTGLPADVATHRYDLLQYDEPDEQAAMLRVFAEACPQIAAAEQPTLVHCRHGEQRSASLVTAYLMYAHGYSLPDARAMVQRRHPAAYGCGAYVHFMPALRAWQDKLSQNR